MCTNNRTNHDHQQTMHTSRARGHAHGKCEACRRCRAQHARLPAAPQSGRTSVAPVRGQSHTERTMRLFTLSMLLLFFFSSGTNTFTPLTLKGCKSGRLKPETCRYLCFFFLLESERGDRGREGWTVPRWSSWFTFCFSVLTKQKSKFGCS